MAQAPVKHDLELEKALGQIELIRRFEETLLELFSAGMLSGTTHTCIGQEVCAYGVVDALDRKRDIVFSTHRCHGHFLMYSPNVEGLLAEVAASTWRNTISTRMASRVASFRWRRAWLWLRR